MPAIGRFGAVDMVQSAPEAGAAHARIAETPASEAEVGAGVVSPIASGPDA